jgi:hypothetical protein
MVSAVVVTLQMRRFVFLFLREMQRALANSADAIVGSWWIGVQIRRRTCNGDCSYESFVVERELKPEEAKSQNPGRRGLHFDSCKTGFRPYDLAVQCALLVIKHHLGKAFEVYSSGSDWHWNDARRICYVHVGYPLSEFMIDRDAGLIEP